jgi:Protein of unknown function (DUF3307)
MELLISLLLAHFLADFVLQPDSWVKDKERRTWKSPWLFAHIGIYGALTIALAGQRSNLIGLILLIVSHLFIDIVKVLLHDRVNKKYLFIGDQFLHFTTIVIAANYYQPFIQTIEVPWLVVSLLSLFIVLVTSVTSIVMRFILSALADDLEDVDEESLLNAGRYIGILERLFVFAFILTNQWQAIGFLLAAKSVFRFGDLKESKDRKLTEYILIGTLLSFGLAIAAGICFKYLFRLIP